MVVTEATVRTPLASRYLVLLCKHFRHKVTVDYSETDAKVDFPWGSICVMQAVSDTLHIRLDADDQAGLERSKYVLSDHLARFSRKENLELTWMDQQP
ncbi:DUF2218 domain-containing protein [Lacibacterium aquatile]|uniref:DUF2218 domain-containing protein n=1 Tax=Lacibacterium aquatile TaxID=1168082 RepID=A0ABW5DVX1_9PROT